MNLKKLTQAVLSRFIGNDYDAKDWTASLIERQDVPTSAKSSFESQLSDKRNFEELHDKPFTPCRSDVPTAADIDWSKAPDGATHLWREQNLWYKFKDSTWFCFFENRWGWEKSNTIRAGSDAPYHKDPSELIPRPESITDVARSIEAARVAEKNGQSARDTVKVYDCRSVLDPLKNSMPYPDGDERYFETSPVQRDAIQIANAATQHMRDRAATYDQPQGERSMCRAIDAFNTITGRDLAESEGWLLLQLLKDVRQWSSDAYHQDSAEDCIAYAALKAEALERGK